MPPRPRPAPTLRPPKVLQPGGGEALHVLDEVATFKVTAGDGQGALSLLELECPPGGGVPLHAHDVADHVLYVLDGAFALTLDGRRETMLPGACAVIPRGHAHGYANVGAGRGRLLVIATPPASEARVFLELAAMLATGPGGSSELTSAIRLLGARHDVSLPPTPEPPAS
ncbi:MAG: cupin domain-containing protein [Gemmatirosa sp.]